MYNDYYLLKKIEEKEGDVLFAKVQDSFTYCGEVVECPIDGGSYTNMPVLGDKVIFLKGQGEDIGELKAIKFEDIIKKI